MSAPTGPESAGPAPTDPVPPAGGPSLASAARDILTRALLPGLVVWLVIVGLGMLIMGPLGEIQAEEAVNDSFVRARNPSLDTVTHIWSSVDDTWPTIVSGIVFGLIILWLTRRWWWGLVPVLAITLESSIFVIATRVVSRPRPEVSRLDEAPPTSSFPSGHTAAAFALYLSVALLAQRSPNPWVRRGFLALAIVLPVGVGVSRLYRGMHHLTDVVIGALLGIWCAFAAARAIRAPEDEAARCGRRSAKGELPAEQA